MTQTTKKETSQEVKKPTIKDMLNAQNAISDREAQTTEAKIKALIEGDKKRTAKRAATPKG